MRPLSALVVLAVLAMAIAMARPAASVAPEPVPSAARPAAAGTGDQSFARRGMEALRSHLASKEGELEGEELSLPAVGLAARCIAAEGTDQAVLCQYGPTDGDWVAQALLWREHSAWLGQLYPQGPDWLATERRQHFQSEGCGCRGRVRQARLGSGEKGLELLVVVDLGTTEAPMEEVHLLRLEREHWSLDWAPAPGNWNWGHAKVTLSQPGLTGFGVRYSSWGRQDRFSGYLTSPPGGEHRWFTERWVRKGAGYVLRDQSEERGPYGALVRLVYYLSHHDEERSGRLLGTGIDLEQARKALAQQPPRQGWKVVQSGPTTFGLDRDGDGKPDLQAGFEEQEGEWILTSLGPPG